MEVVVWKSPVYLPARLATLWRLPRSPRGGCLRCWLCPFRRARGWPWGDADGRARWVLRRHGSLLQKRKRDRSIEGHVAGQGQLGGADKKEKDHESSASAIQNAEPEEEKAKNQQKYQCAVCGRWCGSRRSCSTCGGPSFEVRRGPTRFSSLETLVGGRPGAAIVRKMLDRARPVMELMDEEKFVWGVGCR